MYARQIYKQQQANIGYHASNERRYFKGVQGSTHGELFGLENIFSFDPDRSFLRAVLNKTIMAEQGITMAEFNFSHHEWDKSVQLDSVDDVSGVRQFAKFITGSEEEKEVDPVTAILLEVGVEYTHVNTDIIGPSRGEEMIPEKANDGGGDLLAYLSAHGVGGNQYKIGHNLAGMSLIVGMYHRMYV